jgi:hypothetical protein
MLVNKKRFMIPVLAAALVTLMALLAAAPALASTASRGEFSAPREAQPVERTDPKGTLHVAKLGAEELPWFDSRHRRLAFHVLIVDQGGRAVASATVRAVLDISSSDIAPLVAKTDRNGLATFELLIPRASEGKFCVDNVVKEGYEYDPGKNELTCLEVLPR